MDTSDSKITFDEHGVCDHCITFYKKVLPNWYTDERGRQALDQIVEKIKHAGSGKARSEALVLAMNAVRAIHPHPYFWGSFLLFGN